MTSVGPMFGVCPECGEGWLHDNRGQLTVRCRVGESFWCYQCAGDRVAIPGDPSKRSPETVEILRLKKELASMTRRCEQAEICYRASSKELREWMRSGDTLHDRFIVLEGRLDESRRNFETLAKSLRSMP